MEKEPFLNKTKTEIPENSFSSVDTLPENNKFEFDESLIFEAVKLAKESAPVKKEGFKQKVDSIIRKTMLAVTLYATTCLVVDVAERGYAYKKNEDLKEILAKYKKEYIPQYEHNKALYIEKYNKAVELFGEENLSFLRSSENVNEETMEDINYREKRLDDKAEYLTDFALIMNEWKTNVLIPEFLFDSEYIKDEDYQERQLQKLVNPKQQEFSPTEYKQIDIKGEDRAAIVFNEGASNIDDTLRAESFNNILKRTYPKGWFSGEVENIDLTNKKIFTSGEGNLKAYGKQFEEGGHFEPEKEKIVLPDVYNKFKNDKAWFFTVISHEGSHANDWYSNSVLNQEERLDLLLSVCDRIDDDDRFISSYVEGINPSDIHQKNMTRSTEYWAEICAEYFTHGPKNLSPKDVSIIESIIKKKDPYFDIEKAIEIRRDIMNNEVHKSPINKELREITDKVRVLYTQLNENDKDFWRFLTEHQYEIQKDSSVQLWDIIEGGSVRDDSDNPFLNTLISIANRSSKIKIELIPLVKRYNEISNNKEVGAWDISYTTNDF